MIIVHKLVIHEIIKNDGETQKTDYKLSENLLNIEEQATSMIEELERRYSSLTHTNAVFDKDNEDELKQVPKLFYNYQDPEKPEYDFLHFSKDTAKNLKSYINHVPPAKGGYLIYVEYENKHKFVAVFLVRNKKGNSFQFDSNKQIFKIGESIYIDFENLAMAARINVTLINSTSRYITFINKAQLDSKYFLNWFCADDKQNNIEDTKTLRKILTQIDLPTDENGVLLDRTYFIDKVYNHIRTLPKAEFINLKSLGMVFYNDSEKLTSFAQDNNLVINTEFKANKQELKKYVNLNVQADKIMLNFPLQYIDKGIIIVQNNKIIINSEILFKKVQSEQKEHE